MGTIEKILDRANHGNIVAFLIEGGDMVPRYRSRDNGKTLDDQNMEAEKIIEVFLKKHFKNIDDYEKAYDEIYSAISMYQEIYMEVGMRSACNILI